MMDSIPVLLSNACKPISVTVLGIMTDVIPLKRNAYIPIVRRELLAANDRDSKERQVPKAPDSRDMGRGRCSGEVCRYSKSKRGEERGEEES